MTENKSTHYDITRLNKIPVSRVVEHLGGVLKKRGAQLWTQCLWHTDSNPSLALTEKDGKNYFHCFVCGKTYSVIDYTMQHQGIGFKDACQLLSQEFGIPAVGYDGYRPIRIQKRTPVSTAEKPVVYIPTDIAIQSVNGEDNFSRCLYQLFDAYLVNHVIEEYLIGCYNGKDLRGAEVEGGTIFWHIDTDDRVHNGKMQIYDDNVNSESFCHYDKGNGRMQYIGWQYQRSGIVDKNGVFDNNCLYGEHLLKAYPSAKVVLVESPKNAILGACFDPTRCWVAVGSKGMLKPDVLKPLANRQVIVMPDRDAIADWKEQIPKLRTLANFHVSDFCERYAPEGARNYDVADYIISQRIQDVPF